MPVTRDRVRPLSLTNCWKYVHGDKISFHGYIMGWGEVRPENVKEMSSAEVKSMVKIVHGE